MGATLYRVIVPVDDIELASDFYGSLFDAEGERVSPGRHYFDLGGTILAIYDPGKDGDEVGEWVRHENQYIYISVDNLEDSLDKAKKLGATILSGGIALMPWGERLFYALDPCGTPICLVDEETVFRGSKEQ